MVYRRHKAQTGFSLIELMIVVVIIGVLASMAIPRFMKTSIKSKQSEAEGILKQLYVHQRVYCQEYNTYAANGQSASAGGAFAVLGVEIMGSARYTYVIIADSTSFRVTATANLDDDATIDTWTIDEAGSLQCTADDAET
jgi:type IV pilus assembly protein PilA